MDRDNIKIICHCTDCNTAIYEDNRNVHISQGEVYNDIIADDGDITIYQCPNCGEKIYTR